MSDNPLIALFASRSLVRLLSVFLMNPDEAYYQQQLVRMVGGSLRPAQVALERLVESGIVTVRRDGRQAYYRARRDHPAFADLRALFARTFAVADVIRSALVPLDGIEIAFVHGSVASGEEHAGSDIDVFVVGSASLRDVSAALTTVERSVGREVNLVLYDHDEAIRLMQAGNAFFTDVMAKPKIIVIGDPDALGAGTGGWAPQASTAEPV